MIDFLLDEFENLASITGSVPKLREIVLQLAVSGRLTADWRHQHPDTEPASELLKRIESEKQRLIKEGKIKKQKPLPEIATDEKPFDIPDTWRWASVGSISVKTQYGTATKSQPKGKVPVLRMGNIQPPSIDWTSLVYTSDEEEIAKYRLELGDVLFNRTNSRELVGKSALYDSDRPAIFAGYIIKIVPADGVDSMLLVYFLNSPTGRSISWRVKSDGINQSNISGSKLAAYPFPLAPSTEQTEIVRRVDQLMDLCDRLEQSHEKRDHARQSVVISLCSHLVEPDSSVPFSEVWNQFVDRIAEIVYSPEDLKPVRDMVLQLAVSGRLTADWRHQHPDTEPASELLKRIESEKQRLIKEGKIKKQKPLPEITDDEKPFDIPEPWNWSRLGDISSVSGGKRLPAGHSFSETATEHRYITVTNMKSGTIVDEPVRYIESNTRKMIEKYTIASTDIYITIAGTIGAVGTVPDIFDGQNLTENAAKISLGNDISRRFSLVLLSSPVSKAFFAEQTNKQAQPKLALKRIRLLPMALPPIDEELEIVRRVDQLVDLCDKLETTLTEAKTTGVNLWTSLSAAVITNV